MKPGDLAFVKMTHDSASRAGVAVFRPHADGNEWHFLPPGQPVMVLETGIGGPYPLSGDTWVKVLSSLGLLFVYEDNLKEKEG